MIPKPFLKWVGGKTQLLYELEKRLPISIRESGEIKSYVEPFIGGGSVFFFLKDKYLIKRACLLDSNKELIMAYKVLRDDNKALIDILDELETFHLEKDEDGRKKNFYNIRGFYNQQKEGFDYFNPNEEWIKRTGYLIFLNKTCYNGLFRLNNKGEFNVPFGRYKNPKIYDKANIRAVHKALQNTELYTADFDMARKLIKKESFVYMDPPYRPLNSTSHFTDYSIGGFNESDQKRLAQFYSDMDQIGTYLLLSNSDPHNTNPADDFFDQLYSKYHIERVQAKRNINSNPVGRGEINELLIRNYPL
jgi:DNA adenine methylase